LGHPILPCEGDQSDLNGVAPSRCIALRRQLKWLKWGHPIQVKWPKSGHPIQLHCFVKWSRWPKWGRPIQLHHLATMRKYKVLQLGLQLGFLVAMDTCNSWCLYSLECYWTSCNNCSGHPMSYIILYIWCNPHAIICKGESMVKYVNEGYFFFGWKVSIN
jgi:hypothetical protein